MTYKEMYLKAKKIYEENEYEYNHIGIRFENKDRQVNEVCDFSRVDPDRDDVRDYPDYGTDEYNEMDEIDGTCSYDLSCEGAYDWSTRRANRPARSQILTDHVYIIAGNSISHAYAEDDYEIIIKDARVIAKLF